MANINPNLSTITLNISGLSILIGREQQNFLKAMIQLYAVYKRHTLDSKV